MDVTRNADGTLTVIQPPDRHAGDDLDVAPPARTLVLHPGEGGYAEALAEWDAQQSDRGEAVSTPSGREQAMHVVHVVAEDPKHVGEAIGQIDDPQASAEALRHVLVGGIPSVAAFAEEVAEAEGGAPLPAHKVQKIIGQVLGEIDG
jgi:hypothetical protein